MLCCGVLALLAAMGLGAWRAFRAYRRVLLAVAATLLAAGPLAAAAAVAAGDNGLGRGEGWAAALGVVCRGGRP